MNLLNKSIYLVILFSILISCTKTEEEEKEPILNGELSFSIQLSETNKNTVRLSKSIEEFSFIITNLTTDDIVIDSKDYESIPEVFELLEGEYSIEVTNEKLSSGFESPRYFGVETFSIKAQERTDIEVACKLENIKVKVVFSDLIKKSYPSIFANIKTSNSNELVYPVDENRNAYLSEGSISFTLYFENEVAETVYKEIEGSKANDAYVFYVKTDKDEEQTFDDATIVESITINESWKIPYLNFLVGDGNKQWKIDEKTEGHLALGSIDSYTPDWWVCNAYNFENMGIYDDRMSFLEKNNTFQLLNNTTTLIRNDNDQVMVNYYDSLEGATLSNDSDIHHLTYTINHPHQDTWAWNLYKNNEGNVYLKFKNGAFPIYHVGLDLEYEVILLNDNELTLRAIDTDGIVAHYIVFLKEGYERPDVSTSVKQALLDIYNQMDGSSWNNDHDFNSDKPVREWRNLKVDNNGKLTELNLSRLGLKGEIPVTISDLKDLKYLDLSENHIVGTLPVGFSKFSDLITLHLGNNQFSGTIPNEWSLLITLNSLKLNENQLEGEIPSYLNGFEKFWIFKIENNNFSGVIPKDLFDKLNSYAPWNEFTYDEKNNPYN
ncbi:DUF4493 domain-containing protein [Flammeovirga pectinis]|uniref:DUF4493 domain-containing protein n=1 Tax=Flammeovirga pectinis TaxID=2494373 RepID=A0A3S9PA06_9BACT|nr:DUF4493 domain-containing protein [Flammeovirga pectinis]AZQ65055.1 DUF4493 domain-containing protein [Flammeovirga pectinis]